MFKWKIFDLNRQRRQEMSRDLISITSRFIRIFYFFKMYQSNFSHIAYLFAADFTTDKIE